MSANQWRAQVESHSPSCKVCDCKGVPSNVTISGSSDCIKCEVPELYSHCGSGDEIDGIATSSCLCCFWSHVARQWELAKCTLYYLCRNYIDKRFYDIFTCYWQCHGNTFRFWNQRTKRNFTSATFHPAGVHLGLHEPRKSLLDNFPFFTFWRRWSRPPSHSFGFPLYNCTVCNRPRCWVCTAIRVRAFKHSLSPASCYDSHALDMQWLLPSSVIYQGTYNRRTHLHTKTPSPHLFFFLQITPSYLCPVRKLLRRVRASSARVNRPMPLFVCNTYICTPLYQKNSLVYFSSKYLTCVMSKFIFSHWHRIRGRENKKQTCSQLR